MNLITEFLFMGLGPAAVTVAYTVLRMGVGVFFATSGANKLFNPGRHCTLKRTLEEDHIPCVNIMCWFVPTVEFLGGLALIVGFLTPLAALGLLILMLVAMACEARKRVAAYKPINAADTVCDYLYLPEVVYALVLVLIMTVGGGPVALDTLTEAFFFG